MSHLFRLSTLLIKYYIGRRKKILTLGSIAGTTWQQIKWQSVRSAPYWILRLSVSVTAGAVLSTWRNFCSILWVTLSIFAEILLIQASRPERRDWHLDLSLIREQDGTNKCQSLFQRELLTFFVFCNFSCFRNAAVATRGSLAWVRIVHRLCS